MGKTLKRKGNFMNNKSLILYEKYCVRCKHTKRGQKCYNKFLELTNYLSKKVKKKSFNEDIMFSCFKRTNK